MIYKIAHIIFSMTWSKSLDPNKFKIEKKLHKIVLIYYAGYMTFRYLRHAKINSVNPLYLIVNKMNGCFEEINGNKYLTKLLLMKAKK